MNTSETFMKKAIELSQVKMEQGCGGPFGAVIVQNGQIISEGWNKVTSSNDPTAHAEVEAIREASKKLGRFDLSDCEIYTSCEPCPMCLSAIYWAKISKIYYANTKEDAAAIEFADDFLYKELVRSRQERSIPMQRLLEKEALRVFEIWNNKIDKVSY